MAQHDSLNRRTILAGGGALFIGAAFGPARLHAQTGSGGKIPIGTVGAGHIGGTIGGLWVKDGHKVLFSSRHPEGLEELGASLGPSAQAGTVHQGIPLRAVWLISA